LPPDRGRVGLAGQARSDLYDMVMLFLIDQYLPVRIEAELVRQEQAHLTL
jgi:hypothetical protein